MVTRNNGGCGKMCPHTGQNREKTAYRYVLAYYKIIKLCLIDHNIWFHKMNDLDFSKNFKKILTVPSKLTYINNEKFPISKSLLKRTKV